MVLSPLERTCERILRLSLQCYCDNNFSYFAGVDVLNGSFNGTAPENCEGGTSAEILVHLVHCDYFVVCHSV